MARGGGAEGMALAASTGWEKAAGAGAWTRPLDGGYRLWAQVPAGDAPGGPLPVLWALDGAGLFPLVSAMLGWLSRRPGRSGVAPMLVAAIDHDPPDPARRYADFSFGAPRDPADALGEVEWGGGADFARLLTGQAFEAVADAFAPDPARAALLGHSLAGQFALRLLAEQPGAFAVTGAISPSIWWDREELLALLGAVRDDGQAVFLGVGEREEPSPSRPPAGDDRRRGARLMVSNAAAAGRILSRRLGETRAPTAIMPGEDHASALPAALPKFLRFASARLGSAAPRISG